MAECGICGETYGDPMGVVECEDNHVDSAEFRLGEAQDYAKEVRRTVATARAARFRAEHAVAAAPSTEGANDE